MEVKCQICGTINDSEDKFCKGCFQKIDVDRVIEEKKVEDPKIEVEIKEEEPKEVLWEKEITTVNSNTELPDEISWENQVMPSVTIEEEEKPAEEIWTDAEENEVADNQNVDVAPEEVEIPIISAINEGNEVVNQDYDIRAGLYANKPIVSEEVVEGIIEDNIEAPQAEDTWSNTVVEEHDDIDESPNFLIKFGIIYLISLIVLFGLAFFIDKRLDDNSTGIIIGFILYRIAALISMIIPGFFTFRTVGPTPKTLNKVTFQILGFIVTPVLILELLILLLKGTTILMFIIAVILTVISIVIFFNFMRNTIRSRLEIRKDDKEFFAFAIGAIVIIVGLFGLMFFYKNNNIELPHIKFVENIFAKKATPDPEYMYNFIDAINKTILKNQTEIEDYQIPEKITDVEFATYEENKLDAVDLTLNEEGAIVSGTLKYKNIKYIYDGAIIKAK